ncbi:DUF1924 domain-containing protein [Motiliproteus coralliicola]|uniref:DUF1924 domain-containing protein n=1 Tax=Motiliproteus coralliicola TaxID=2283196 RepID=A0A369WDL5_9GAMM|nr:DUF1924 domain-containing protein [Motiliproteus coralliicola]RDE19383.1 DUF1924 domain-containing protein [Motiliproteus coralliicola]
MSKPVLFALLNAWWLTFTPISHASPIHGLLDAYRNQGAEAFSAKRGEQLWLTQRDGRRCGSCHTDDPKAPGKHQKTGKAIKPLAPSVNAERLTSEKTIKKWLKRNCKWTLRRECTAQEKGDFLTWLLSR